MTVQNSELYGPAERIQKWTNRGTEESRREFNKIIFSLKHCMFCLRRIAKNPASRNSGQPHLGPRIVALAFRLQLMVLTLTWTKLDSDSD